MSCTSSTSPPPRDIARDGWAALTARIAWAMMVEGVRVRPDVLRNVREHVLYHLEPDLSLPDAEDRAAFLVGRFIKRARNKLFDAKDTDHHIRIDPMWRRAVEQACQPLDELLFVQHYRDRVPIETLCQHLNIDDISWEAARGGLHEVLRRVVQSPELPVLQWPAERLDGLLYRVAEWAPEGQCPSLPEMVTGTNADHVQQCARCSRILRLIRAQRLTYEDLVAPTGSPRPQSTTTVLALNFHPDHRRYRNTLDREIAVPTQRMDDDVLLIRAGELEPLVRVLWEAAEIGAPNRDQIRGVLVSGPGRWSRNGLLGPLPGEARRVVRSRPWGHIDGVGELPSALPAPPPLRTWWAGIIGLAAIALFVLQSALAPVHSPFDHPVSIEFVEARGGVWMKFDVDDHAWVSVVQQEEDLVMMLDSKSPADKANFAVGDGSYLVHSPGDAVLIASTADIVTDLGTMVQQANSSNAPLDQLAQHIRRSNPRADVRIFRR